MIFLFTVTFSYVYASKEEVFLVSKIKTKIYEETELYTVSWRVIKDDDATNNKAIIADKWYNLNKHVVFWPYSKNEKPGKHKAIFRLKTDNNKVNKNIAKIEVFNTNWDWVNNYINIKWTDFENSNKYQDFEINYIRTKQWSLEFRVLYYWNTKLFFDNVRNIWEY